MGRFYKTANSQFIDYMFKPNVKLNLALAQQEIQNDYLKSKLLQYAPDVEVQHLGMDNDKVKELQSRYDNAITDLSKKMYDDPDNSQKYIVELKKLQKDMLQDKTSGDWYNIEQRAAGVQNWLKENEDKKSSIPGVYEALKSHWLNKLAEDVKTNPAAKFEGQRVVSRPDALSKKMLDIYSKMKASTTQTTKDGYDITSTGIDPQKLEQLAWNELQSDPEFQAYVHQMGSVLKQPGYYDDNGNFINPFQLINGEGHPISYEDYKRLSPEKRRQVTKQLNPKSAFASDLSAVGETFGYNKTTYKPNAYTLQERKLKAAQVLASGKTKSASKLDSDIVGDTQILRLSRSVVPFSTINTSFDDWFALSSKKLAGKDYDATKLLELNAMIDPFVSKYGDTILSSYGDDPKSFKNFEDKKAEVVRILKDINKADSDPNYGIRQTQVANQYAGSGFSIRRDDAGRQAIEDAKSSIENKWGDYKDFLSKNMTLAVNFKTIGNDDTSKKVLNIINTYGNFVKPNVRTRNKAVFDLNGKSIETSSIKFDAKGDGSGTTDNPAQAMVTISGKSISELIADQYLSVAYRPTGKNQLTVVFSPTKKFENEFATMQDAKIGGNDIRTFSETFSGVSGLTNIFRKSDNPDENELYLRAKYGKQYILASDKVYYQEGLQKKNPELYDIYSKGYTLKMPYFNKDVLVGYQLDNKGGMYIRGKNTKNKKSFEKYISASSIQKSGLDRVSALKMLLSSQLANLEEFRKINNYSEK